MRVSTAIELGRVSNLPTVWTNALAGVALTGVVPELSAVAVLALVLSLFYTAGIYLNDAFDREVDARERPERPIPSGRASVREVFAFGFGLLGLGLALSILVPAWLAAGSIAKAAAAAAWLAAAIVIYDSVHKRVSYAALLMASCRALAYALAAVAVARDIEAARLGIAMAGLFAYVTGLTAIASQETGARLRRPWPLILLAAPVPAAFVLGGWTGSTAVFAAVFAAWSGCTIAALLRPAADIGLGVSRMIAGICLVDAVFLAACGFGAHAALACACAPLTRALQRRIAGT